MNASPKISVVICTHNRAPYLKRALESLIRQTLPQSDYEVIVVDNASTDETQKITHEFSQAFQHFCYFYEERLGLSWARNTGAQLAAAPYIAYLDDDASACTEWLKSLLQCFEKSVPSPSAIGGKVWLDWEGEPPSWLPRRYWSVYTHLDYGDGNRVLTNQEYLVGANMAFTKKALAEAGNFNTDLGRKGQTLLSGEEAELLKKIREKGGALYYCGSARVRHTVPKARQHKGWLFKRMFWDGASQPLIDYGPDKARSFYASQCLYDLRRMAVFFFQAFFPLLKGNQEQFFDHLMNLIQRSGRFRTNFLFLKNK